MVARSEVRLLHPLGRLFSGPAGEWNGKPFKGYAEHLMRIEKIPLAEYKPKVVEQFDPEKFNAEEWV